MYKHEQADLKMNCGKNQKLKLT